MQNEGNHTNNRHLKLAGCWTLQKRHVFLLPQHNVAARRNALAGKMFISTNARRPKDLLHQAPNRPQHYPSWSPSNAAMAFVAPPKACWRRFITQMPTIAGPAVAQDTVQQQEEALYHLALLAHTDTDAEIAYIAPACLLKRHPAQRSDAAACRKPAPTWTLLQGAWAEGVQHGSPAWTLDLPHEILQYFGMRLASTLGVFSRFTVPCARQMPIDSMADSSTGHGGLATDAHCSKCG